MSALVNLRKLVLGETWFLTLGVAAVIATADLVVRPLAGSAWEHAGGFVLLAGVLAVLLAGVARSQSPRSAGTLARPTPPREGSVSDYVAVETAANEAMADLIKQRLDEAEIPCVIVSGGMAAVTGAGSSYTVTVPADRAEEARELLGD